MYSKFDKNSVLGRVNASQKYNKFSAGMETGEITGMYVENKEYEKGMPMRNFMNDSLKKDKNRYQFKEHPRSRMDFDVYEKESNIDVSYFDPSAVYSSVGEKKMTKNASFDDSFQGIDLPVKKQVDGFPHMVNTFGLDMFMRLMGKVDLSKNIGLAPYFVLSLLAVIWDYNYIYNQKPSNSKYAQDPTSILHNKYDKIFKSIFGNMKDELLMRLLKDRPNFKFLNVHYDDYFNNTCFKPIMDYNQYTNRVKSICMTLGYEDKKKYKIKGLNKMINSYFRTNSAYLNEKDFPLTKGRTMHYVSIFKFDPILIANDIKNDDFYGLNKKSSIDYACMFQSEFLYTEDSLHEVLEIPINPETTIGFIKSKTKYFNKLSPKMFDSYSKSVEPKYFNNVSLPIFHFKKAYKINGILNDIGLSCFDYNKFYQHLDFNIKYQIRQKRMEHANGGQFVVNSSFYYYIKYRSMIVYMGKVANIL